MKRQYVLPEILLLTLRADTDILDGSYEIDLGSQYDEDIEAWLKHRGELPEGSTEK